MLTTNLFLFHILGVRMRVVVRFGGWVRITGGEGLG